MFLYAAIRFSKVRKKLYVISIFLIALHQIAIPMALSFALFAVVAVLAAKLVSRLKAEGADPEKEQPTHWGAHCHCPHLRP
jgi:ABC-type transport system involved in cytochrome bd biosynthesis fused ATPase/permease subunit